MSPDAALRLRRAAWAAFAAHLVAGLAMAFVLRHGLETNPDVASRMAFLSHHRVAWTLGWLSWTASAFTILAFLRCFGRAHGLPETGFAVGAAAVVFDLSAQAIEVGILPQVTSEKAFVALHGYAVTLTGVEANALYTLATALVAWPVRERYPAWVNAAAAGVVAGGIALSVSAAAGWTAGMVLANVLLVPALLVWLAAVAKAA